MDENNCQYISSIGIMKSCNHYNTNSKSSSDDLSYLDTSKIFENDSIYVCNTGLKTFIHNFLDKIKTYFTLISGDSDESMPYEVLSTEDFHKLTKYPYLLNWFCQNYDNNCGLNHYKIIPMPIGMDYHTIFRNQDHYWNVDQKMKYPTEQENELISIKNKGSKIESRLHKIYNNTNLCLDRFGTRQDAIDKIKSELIVHQQSKMNRSRVWEEYIKYAFVLSPYGNGYDCHRTYEAILLGCIPIVLSGHIDKMLLDLDVPILIVNNFYEITQTLLDDMINKVKTQNVFLEKLQLQYWTNKIHNYIRRNKSVIFCSTVKNISQYVDIVYNNIQKLFYMFDEYKIVFYYDNSNDNTLDLLNNLKNRDSNIKIFTNTEALSHERVHNITKGRNVLLDYIKNYYDHYTYMVMIDFDNVSTGEINPSVLEKYINDDKNWDCLSFNRNMYYDIWALQYNSIVHHYLGFNEHIAIQNCHKLMTNEISDTLANACEMYNRTGNLEDSLFEVHSAFNGFAIHKIYKILNMSYSYNYIQYFSDCHYDIMSNMLNYKIDNSTLSEYNIRICEHINFYIESKLFNNARVKVSALKLFLQYI